MKKRKKIDYEEVIICVVSAVITSFGLIAGGAAFAGISFQECDGTMLAGIFLCLSGILCSFLLLFNRKIWSKRG